MPATLSRSVFLLSLPVLVGCNLADYEQRMLDAQAAVRQRDEEAKLLEVPMDFPTPKDASLDIFLRPPRGINPTLDNSEKLLAGWIGHYPRSSSASVPPGGTGKVPGTPPQPTGPATPTPPGTAPTGLGPNEAAFIEAFAGYRIEQGANTVQDDFLKQFPRVGDVAKKTRTITSPGSPSIEAETWECSAADLKSTYLFIFARSGLVSLAIVYRIEPGKLPYAQVPIELSLRTLAVGADATKARAAYERDRQIRLGR